MFKWLHNCCLVQLWLVMELKRADTRSQTCLEKHQPFRYPSTMAISQAAIKARVASRFQRVWDFEPNARANSTVALEVHRCPAPCCEVEDAVSIEEKLVGGARDKRKEVGIPLFCQDPFAVFVEDGFTGRYVGESFRGKTLTLCPSNLSFQLSGLSKKLMAGPVKNGRLQSRFARFVEVNGFSEKGRRVLRLSMGEGGQLVEKKIVGARTPSRGLLETDSKRSKDELIRKINGYQTAS